MSGSKPGPDPTLVRRWTQSLDDSKVDAALRAFHRQVGGPLTKTVQYLIGYALAGHGFLSQEEVPAAAARQKLADNHAA